MGDPRITGAGTPSFFNDQGTSIQDSFVAKLNVQPPNDPFAAMKQFLETLSPSDAQNLFDQLQTSNPLASQFNEAFDATSRADLLSTLSSRFQASPATPTFESPVPTPITDPKTSNALKGEVGLRGSIREAQIRADLETGGVDSFEVGEQMADLAKKDPAAAKKAIEETLNKLPEGERDDFAWSFTAHLSDDELKVLASTPDGQSILNSMNKELNTGRMDSDEIDQSKRIDDAIKLNSRLVSLQKSKGFAQLPEATRKAMMNAMQKYGDDPLYAKALKKLASTQEFTDLQNDQSQIKVIKDIGKFTETKSYAWMSKEDKTQALNIIKTLSIDAEGGGSKTPVARNTLKHLVDGSVGLELRDMRNDQLDGEAKTSGKVILNTRSENLFDTIDDLVTTVTHEVNHVLNGNTAEGTPERFLDEYRAYFVERQAVGENSPAREVLLDNIKKLAADTPDTSSPYNHLRLLYKNNPQFKAVVDRMIQDLGKKPPHITTPEELRLKLRALPGGANSKYLNRASNMDNH